MGFKETKELLASQNCCSQVLNRLFLYDGGDDFWVQPCCYVGTTGGQSIYQYWFTIKEFLKGHRSCSPNQCSDCNKLEPVYELDDRRISEWRPSIIGFNFFHECNFHCKLCYSRKCTTYKNKPPFLTRISPAKVQQMVKVFVKKNEYLESLLWGEGEFFASREGRGFYAEILRLRPDIKLQIITNGSLFDVQKILEVCSLDRVFNIDVSLYGASNETYEVYTGTQGTWDRLSKTIVECMSQFPEKMSFNYLVNRDTVADLPNAADFLGELGVRKLLANWASGEDGDISTSEGYEATMGRYRAVMQKYGMEDLNPTGHFIEGNAIAPQPENSHKTCKRITSGLVITINNIGSSPVFNIAGCCMWRPEYWKPTDRLGDDPLEKEIARRLSSPTPFTGCFYNRGLYCDEFFMDISDGERETLVKSLQADNYQPSIINFSMFYECNFRCNFCTSKDTRLLNRKEAVKSYLTLFPKIEKYVFNNPSINFIEWGNGEMSVSAIGRKYVQAALKSNPRARLTLTTNMYAFTEEWVAENIGFDRLASVSASIYGASNETYEKTCHVRGAWDRIRLNLDDLFSTVERYKYTYSIKYVACETNWRDVLAAAKYLHERYSLGIFSVVPAFIGSETSTAYRQLPEYSAMKESLHEYFREHNMIQWGAADF